MREVRHCRNLPHSSTKATSTILRPKWQLLRQWSDHVPCAALSTVDCPFLRPFTVSSYTETFLDLKICHCKVGEALAVRVLAPISSFTGVCNDCLFKFAWLPLGIQHSEQVVSLGLRNATSLHVSNQWQFSWLQRHACLPTSSILYSIVLICLMGWLERLFWFA